MAHSFPSLLVHLSLKKQRPKKDKNKIYSPKLASVRISAHFCSSRQSAAIREDCVWVSSKSSGIGVGDWETNLEIIIVTCEWRFRDRYRFLEIYYRRSETTHKGKLLPARVETVVLFLPDVWSCVPTRLEWDGLHLNYKRQLDRKLKALLQIDYDEDAATVDEKALTSHQS